MGGRRVIEPHNIVVWFFGGGNECVGKKMSEEGQKNEGVGKKEG